MASVTHAETLHCPPFLPSLCKGHVRTRASIRMLMRRDNQMPRSYTLPRGKTRGVSSKSTYNATLHNAGSAKGQENFEVGANNYRLFYELTSRDRKITRKLFIFGMFNRYRLCVFFFFFINDGISVDGHLFFKLLRRTAFFYLLVTSMQNMVATLFRGKNSLSFSLLSLTHF